MEIETKKDDLTDDILTNKNKVLEKIEGTAILENQFKTPYSTDLEAW